MTTTSDVLRTVSVTGLASNAVRPDQATLSLGVQARRPTADRAMLVLDERSSALVAALRDAGARDEDLRTSGLNLWFDQSDRSYVASYSLQVTLPADDVGRFVDAAAEVAGDEFALNGVSFAVSDRGEAVAPLRELAVEDARAKADVLAAAAGCRVGPIVTIVESAGASPAPMPRMAAAKAMSAPIEAGSEVVSLHVTATFELTLAPTTPA